jgi:hypothetical protein
MAKPRQDWSPLEHALALLPVQVGDCPEQLTAKAVKAWLTARPKRGIGPNCQAGLYGLFLGALLRAGADLTTAKDAPGGHILQGWHAQGGLMKEGT